VVELLDRAIEVQADDVWGSRARKEFVTRRRPYTVSRVTNLNQRIGFEQVRLGWGVQNANAFIS
jgi:hypothetical protein